MSGRVEEKKRRGRTVRRFIASAMMDLLRGSGIIKFRLTKARCKANDEILVKKPP